MARRRLDVLPAQRQATRPAPRSIPVEGAVEGSGVREARLHDARHTAATTLLLLGIPERAVMDVMGWSNSAMVKRYSHVTARLRRDIANRLNSFLWTANETTNETEPS
jgi:integrase